MWVEKRNGEMLYPIMNEFRKEKESMTVCFLLTHVPNPRINKRIEIIKEMAQTYVICTRRASQNVWEPAQDIEHIIFDIDLPSAKHIVKRFVISRSFQEKALKKLEAIKPDVIYAEGLDTLIIAGKYKARNSVRIVFEVADLRENFIMPPRKIYDKMITTLLLHKEKKAFKNVDYLVVTSPKFYEMHYSSLISKEKVKFIPNTPNVDVFKSFKRHKGEFTVGFIGGIRYIQQMKMLVDAAYNANCKVLFAGAGGTSSDYEEIQAYCKGKDFVSFTGRYDYEKQIADLYGKVDCVYAVYDANNPNVRIALPNKLYESVYCGLPIIVAKGTYLEELVYEWGVGVAVQHDDVQDLEHVLIELKENRCFYQSICDSCEQERKQLFGEKESNKTEMVIDT